MRFRIVCYWLAIVVIAFPVRIKAGDDATAASGSIRGVTRDSGAQSLAAVRVIVHSVAENTERTVISGSDGAFFIANLRPGEYQVSAQGDGFSTSSSTTVDVGDRQTATVVVPLVKSEVALNKLSTASTPGFFKRFAMAYWNDWHPSGSTANSTAPANTEPLTGVIHRPYRIPRFPSTCGQLEARRGSATPIRPAIR